MLEVDQKILSITLQVLPSYHTKSQYILYARRATGMKEAATRGDIQLTEGQKLTASGQQFLFHDSENDQRV